MRPWNIAHRGGAQARPENTLAAFGYAATCGYDGVELDAQLTRDKEVVVFHDYRLQPELCRGADGRWLKPPTPPIKDLTLAQLKLIDVGRADPASAYARAHPYVVWRGGERIPTLSEVAAVAKKVDAPFYLFVELKTSCLDRESSAPEELAERAVAVLEANDYLDRAVFIGFDWPGLLRVKQIAPNAQCWFSTRPQSWFGEGVPPPEDDPPPEEALRMLRDWARKGISPWAGGFDAVKYGGSILTAIRAAGGDGWFPMWRDASEEAVREAHGLGLKVGVWTVDDPAEMRSLAKRSIDAICTDRPELLKRMATSE